MTSVTNQSLKGVSGIYAIRNTLNGKAYVGSSVDLKKRWRNHRSDLEQGKHHSTYLQHAWNKYGKCNFVFEVLEIVPNKAELISREQHWMDTMLVCDRSKGYNRNPFAASALGIKRTKETRDKISRVQIGRKASKETIERQRLAKLGKPKQGRNGKGIDNFRATEFSFTSPCGTVYTGRNVSLFATEHGLKPGALHDMLMGRRNQHKGWTVTGHSVAKTEKYKEFAFICPEDGKVYTGRGITAFARQHGLSFSLLCAVHRGDIPQYKGWRKAPLKPLQLSLPLT